MDSWRPNPGPQTLFHQTDAYEALYGGAAGGGKTESLLMESLRYIHVPKYTAVLFRRTYGELAQANGLIERSRLICPRLGGTFNEQDRIWRGFNGGGTLMFRHLEHDKDKTKHDSAEYAYIGWDELHTFLETQYDYLGSRCRTTAIDPETGQVVPARIRAASNPPFKAEGMWVKERFFDKLIPFQTKHFARVADVDTEVSSSHPSALSRVYIPAKVYDNQVLMERDPGYIARLEGLSYIDRMRLLEGLWDVPVKGNVFKRDWFTRYVEHPPENLKWVRFWDLAISLKTRASFTASPAMALDDEGMLYLRDMIRFKKDWPDTQKIMMSTLQTEPHIAQTGVEAKLHGTAVVQTFQAMPEMLGFAIIPVNVTVDKLVRALPWSAKAEAGKIVIVNGPWVKAALDEFEVFDGTSSTFDDQVDGVSGGVQMLAKPMWKKMDFMKLPTEGLRV